MSSTRKSVQPVPNTQGDVYGLVTSKEIRKALKNNSAAVEFIETSG